MEYLVTMTTHVPEGTPDDAVGEMRAREAVRARELAAEGHLLRLWRPPLQPGEWRSLGLFQAADGGELETVLTSMPLRVWRTDEVTQLAPHPNDPWPGRTRLSPDGIEFLTTFVLVVPPGTPQERVGRGDAEERLRTRRWGDEGYLLRLWRLPGQGRALGHWQVRDRGELQELLSSLPLAAWFTVDVLPVTRHPSDPADARKPES